MGGPRRGRLKEKFRASITQQIQDAHLDRDLRVDRGKRPLFTPEQIERVESYLHQIHNETTTVSLHVFGQPPPPDLLVPWLVTCLGKRFLDDLGEVVAVPPAAARSTGSRETFLRQKAEEVFHAIVIQNWSVEDALRAAGGSVPAAGLPKRLGEDFQRAKRLQDGFAKTHEEMDNLVAALAGRYIPPGPGNSPERNPAVVPTGRNMYVMNPEEVPSRPSWEIGKALIDQLLAQQLKSKGRYPKKVAFTLNSFATFQDYGVMESQILYLLGVRPVWDDRNLVGDVELIPAAELRRPRIDVFIASGGYYRDMLPTRMHLLDKAIRMVAALDEPENTVHRDSVEVRDELRRQGIEPRQAETLSQARIFGVAPGQIGGTGYYYLVERSGQWNDRKDLMDTYLGFSRYVYTEGLWGKKAAAAYNRQIQGSEVVLRSWSDRTRSPLSNKYDWFIGGSLSLAIKQLTGKEPEWYLSDVRDADRAGLVAAEDALGRDYRVRLFNRKWIEGMMKEGYAGADQIAVHVSNTMGWAIMRDGSVSDDTWNEIAAVYVKDKLGLSLRQWFETQNPYAFQDMSEVLLESSRKGYWKGEPGLVREVAEQYARSVLRHGEGGGLRGGGNARLEQFVAATLRGAKSADLDRLAAQYQGVLRERPCPVGGRDRRHRAGTRSCGRPWPRRLRDRPEAGRGAHWLRPSPRRPPRRRWSAPETGAVARRPRSRGRGGGRCSARSPRPCCCCWADSFIARACHERFSRRDSLPDRLGAVVAGAGGPGCLHDRNAADAGRTGPRTVRAAAGDGRLAAIPGGLAPGHGRGRGVLRLAAGRLHRAFSSPDRPAPPEPAGREEMPGRPGDRRCPPPGPPLAGHPRGTHAGPGGDVDPAGPGADRPGHRQHGHPRRQPHHRLYHHGFRHPGGRVRLCRLSGPPRLVRTGPQRPGVPRRGAVVQPKGAPPGPSTTGSPTLPDKRRRWDALVEDDPLAGLINLFDLWMVFSIALLLSLATFLKLPPAVSDQALARGGDAGTSQVQRILSRARKLPHYHVSRDELSGEGVRLGTAYRLKSGEVVYVPDDGR